jgi:hypothetical protein
MDLPTKARPSRVNIDETPESLGQFFVSPAFCYRIFCMVGSVGCELFGSLELTVAFGYLTFVRSFLRVNHHVLVQFP